MLCVLLIHRQKPPSHKDSSNESTARRHEELIICTRKNAKYEPKGAKVDRAPLNLIASVGYNWYKHIRELFSVVKRYDLYTKQTSVLVRLYVVVLVLVFDGPDS